MTFTAIIRKHSLVWQNWNGARKPCGTLAGVTFFWEPGDVYRSEILNPEQIAALRDSPSVRLELVGAFPLDDSSVEEPLVPPPPAPEPRPKWQPPERFMKPSVRGR